MRNLNQEQYIRQKNNAKVTKEYGVKQGYFQLNFVEYQPEMLENGALPDFNAMQECV
jgi:hypothetical protein